MASGGIFLHSSCGHPLDVMQTLVGNQAEVEGNQSTLDAIVMS